MRCVVCVKQVLDPEAINAFAVAGRLLTDPATHTLSAEGLPWLVNPFDEQAMEAALRLRDADGSWTIAVISVNPPKQRQLFTRAFALGIEQGYVLQEPSLDGADALATAHALERMIAHIGGADLVVCGRQASDDDQGAVGPALAALLDAACVTVAKSITLVEGGMMRITRVLPDGEEEVEARLPAVVTVSNELGEPRFPKASDQIAARSKQPVALTAAETGLQLPPPRVRRSAIALNQVKDSCEIVQGADVQSQAETLALKLQEAGLL